MADDYRGKASYPQRGSPRESNYPPLPGDDDSRPPMAAATTTTTTTKLPGIFDTFGAPPQSGPPSRYPPDGRYPPDPRQADPRAHPGYGGSPNGVNGYHAPPPPQHHQQQQQQQHPSQGQQQQQGGPGMYLPPLQPSADPRTTEYYSGSLGSNYGGYYRGARPFELEHRFPNEYIPGGPSIPVVIQQTAPRQRTSIACKYCRRRKIRCSGYQSGPPGKCSNCLKMNQPCIFEPVSSSSTAFVPLSAIAGGVAPGTQLYGAYGQPISSLPPLGHPYPPQGQGQPGDYSPAMQSPTTAHPPGPPHHQGQGPPHHQQQGPPPQHYGYPDDRSDGGRRRRAEDEHSMRLPPPNPPTGGGNGGNGSQGSKGDDLDSSRRRSPASTHSSDGGPYHSYPPTSAGGYEGRTPPPPPPSHHHRGSPGAPPGSGGGGGGGGQQGGGGGGASNASTVMSLGNLVDGGGQAKPPPDIDRNMLGRLNQSHRR